MYRIMEDWTDIRERVAARKGETTSRLRALASLSQGSKNIPSLSRVIQ